MGKRLPRYEVRATGGWPAKKETIVRCTDRIDEAEKHAAMLRKSPFCIKTRIYDRKENKTVIIAYARAEDFPG